MVDRYLVSRAPKKVRDLFAAACQWHRCLPFQVDGGPCIGGLAEIVVYYCRDGMQPAKRGQSGHDCIDAQVRRVQIKAIGHEKPYFQFRIDPSKADRLITLRIHYSVAAPEMRICSTRLEH